METMISLKGMYDLHVHASPSVIPRKLSALETLKLASAEEMAGVLLLDHTYNTVVVAHILNEMSYGTKVFGSILLNESVGGLNPSVVETAIGLGTKQIQMPTYSAQDHYDKFADGNKAFPYPKRAKGICIINHQGRLISEVEDILLLLKGSHSFLGTGHLSVAEIEALIGRAKDQKVRVLVNGVSNDTTNIPITIQKKMADDNIFMEHDYGALIRVSAKRTPIESIVQQIRAVGAERCVIATDAGQIDFPDLVFGLRDFIRRLLENGITENELNLMTRRNPRILLGIF